MLYASISVKPVVNHLTVGIILTVVFGIAAAVARCADTAAPLPPPPELMDMGYEFEEFDTDVPASPEELRKALTLPTAVTSAPVATPAPGAASVATPVAVNSPPVPQPVYSAPVSGVPVATTNVFHDFTISPPSREMPAAYYNLPVEELVIPGVLLPEYDDDFRDPGFQTPPRMAGTRRPVTQGLSIRQLEPFFALAKGSEAAALEARERGDENTYRDQIEKAIGAYMSVISMADAGTEAREEAWYGVARCEYRRGNWWSSFDALERSFPQQYERSEVAGRVKLEMYIGERLWRIGTEPAPQAVVEGNQLSGYQAASKVYAAAIFNQPIASDAPLALLRRGDACTMEGEWKEAVKYYRQVVEYYPESDQAMQARSSLAEAVLRQEWATGFPEAGREDLSTLMGDVERSHDRLSPEAQERRQRAVELANNMEAETKLRQAKEYLRSIRLKKSRDAGVFLLGEIVSRFPTTAQATEAADILRGMGIEPPMALSDGTRFPLGPSWAADRDEAASTGESGLAGGSVQLGGQDDITDSAVSSFLPPSPTREPVYEPVPGVVEFVVD